jgi:hypothetical protein
MTDMNVLWVPTPCDTCGTPVRVDSRIDQLDPRPGVYCERCFPRPIYDLEPGDTVLAAGQEGTFIEVRRMRSRSGRGVLGLVVERPSAERSIYSPQEVERQP